MGMAHGTISRQVRLLLALAIGLLGVIALIPAASAQDEPSVSIVSPEPGDTVTSTDITIEVEHSGFDDSCSLVGTPDQDGEGHLHVMVDGASMANLINFYCETDTITIPGTALEPGERTIIVTVASNSHMDMMDTATELTIDYQPDDPAPEPEEEDFDDSPVISITNLENGATVGSELTLDVESQNFNAAADLEGKPNLRGYGHYHVFLNMPMADGMPDMSEMSMEGMLAMPGDDTFTLDLSAWPEGEHTLVVMAANNDHTPIMQGEMAMLNFTLDHGDEPDEPELPATGAGGAASANDEGTSLLLIAGGGGAAMLLAIGLLAGWMRQRASW